MFKEIEADMLLVNEILIRVKDDIHFCKAFEAFRKINIFLNLAEIELQELADFVDFSDYDGTDIMEEQEARSDLLYNKYFGGK